MRRLALIFAASCAAHSQAQDATRGPVPDPYRTPLSLSGDGSTVTSMYNQPNRPYRWTWPGTVQFPFTNQRGAGFGLSHNGSILVGWWDAVITYGNPFINAN